MGETLRDRLMNQKKRPTAPCRLQVDDIGPATKAVEEAIVATRLAQVRGEDPAATWQAVREAQAALEGCYETVTLQALRPTDLEALKAAHPPREGNDDDGEWNNETFPRALLLECLPADLTHEDWEAVFAENCSDGEVLALELGAQALNVRAPEGTLPKGLMRMLD